MRTAQRERLISIERAGFSTPDLRTFRRAEYRKLCLLRKYSYDRGNNSSWRRIDMRL